MKEIQLTKGLKTIVDDDDYERLSQFKWQARTPKKENTSYACRSERLGVNKRGWVSMHRFILNAPKGEFVDHRNGDGLDNRKENLRICTKAGNNRNQRKPKVGWMGQKLTSKYKGVSKYSKKLRGQVVWVCKIHCDYKCIHLGYFENEEEAALAYNRAALKYHKEFANLNKVDID